MTSPRMLVLVAYLWVVAFWVGFAVFVAWTVAHL